MGSSNRIARSWAQNSPVRCPIGVTLTLADSATAHVSVNTTNEQMDFS